MLYNVCIYLALPAYCFLYCADTNPIPLTSGLKTGFQPVFIAHEFHPRGTPLPFGVRMATRYPLCNEPLSLWNSLPSRELMAPRPPTKETLGFCHKHYLLYLARMILKASTCSLSHTQAKKHQELTCLQIPLPHIRVQHNRWNAVGLYRLGGGQCRGEMHLWLRAENTIS